MSFAENVRCELAALNVKKPCCRRMLGAGLLLGGSLANLFDRIFRGSVTDYLRFPTLPWKKIRTLVFNLADLCIFFGTVLVLLRTLFPKRK